MTLADSDFQSISKLTRYSSSGADPQDDKVLYSDSWIQPSILQQGPISTTEQLIHGIYARIEEASLIATDRLELTHEIMQIEAASANDIEDFLRSIEER